MSQNERIEASPRTVSKEEKQEPSLEQMKELLSEIDCLNFILALPPENYLNPPEGSIRDIIIDIITRGILEKTKDIFPEILGLLVQDKLYHLKPRLEKETNEPKTITLEELSDKAVLKAQELGYVKPLEPLNPQ